MKKLPSIKAIHTRMRERKKQDPLFGFEWHIYLGYLPYEMVKDLLEDDVDPESWGDVKLLVYDEIVEEMKDYMSFAKDKAEGERGISANRSIMHYLAWVWLAGDGDLLNDIQNQYDNHYYSYGIPILKTICKYYEWDWETF